MSVAVTGAAYVDAMSRDPTDRECRHAFQSRVLDLAPPGGRVLDFGSGPGVDVKAYVAAGLQVSAFDIDADMRDYFCTYCAPEIDTGRATLLPGPYAEFLRPAPADAGLEDLIVANFAPLNLVDDLRPLFAAFATRLKPRGHVLASVLNPWFGQLWRSPKWWTRLPRLLANGRFTTYLHGVIPVTRWLPGRLAREAAPHFALTSIHTPQPAGGSSRVAATSPRDWPRIAANQFLFLEFSRGPHA